MTIHPETVTSELLEIGRKLSAIPELSQFRIVGGTAIALQVGHRKSVDIDFFTNQKVNKREIRDILLNVFPKNDVNVTQYSIASRIKDVRIELFDDWSTPFMEKPITESGLRLATLNDLSAFKLDAIIERREKKDYIDLYVLFEKLGAKNILQQFQNYNPNVSSKSVLFALGEVGAAKDNQSIMPELLIDVAWKDIEKAMISAAREFIKVSPKPSKRRSR